MPELPEVEVITRALRDGGRGGPSIVGHRIEEIHVCDEKLLHDLSPAGCARQFTGAHIKDVVRRAKYICVKTSNGDLIFHLRMTGDLHVDDKPETEFPFQRLDIRLGEDLHLRYTDPRRLGKMWAATAPAKLWQELGPEPLDDSFTVTVLHNSLVHTRQAIKKVLLDGRRVAGLGNIWADEALYLASIHPERPANELTSDETQALWRGIRQALRTGIERTQASLQWVHRGGVRGTPPGEVHLREGEPCARCRAPIKRIRLGGRSTYFCACCQLDKPRASL